MEEYFYLIIGIAILFIALSDFFYTTLSGSGAAFITKACSAATNKLVLKMEKSFGRNVFRVSGLLVNLVMLAVWILLVWFGLFLIYSFNPEAIINNSGKVASTAERLYYTGYVLSTLGIGNFQATSPFLEIVTSISSFFGFVFFTTTMTYLLSISSAVIHKHSLAMSIRNLGKNPAQVINRLQEMDSSFSYQQISNLEQMIIKHSAHYQAYPVLYFYHHPDDANTISINIAILDEALSMMLNSSVYSPIQEELKLLRNTIDHFLNHLKQRFESKADEHPNINWHEVRLPNDAIKEGFTENQDLSERRKILTSMLNNENRSWKNVYPTLGETETKKQSASK